MPVKEEEGGGLDIKNLKKMNLSLLCNWWWALKCGEGLCQDIVRVKYVKNSPTYVIPHRLSDSPIWKSFWRDLLYELASDKKCYVADVRGRDWVIQFRIRLQGIIRD
jgi:hypothetical protein